jgi:hypothetical protein
MRAVAAAIAFALVAGGARAHDQWADGKPIPQWVKSSCCGPDEAHHLRPDQVHRISDDTYAIDGERHLIVPAKDALPSQDGDYWIFYRAAEYPIVHCFFVPMAF